MVAVFWRLLRGPRRRVEAEARAPEGYRLEVIVEGGCVKVKGGGGGAVRLEAEVGPGAVARLEEVDGRVRVLVRRAAAAVEAPRASGLVLSVTRGCARVEGVEAGYAALRARGSSVGLRVRVPPGGGVLVDSSTSSVSATLEPLGPGEYWVEAEASLSSLVLRVEGEKEYTVEGRLPGGAALPPSKPGAPVKVRVRIAKSRLSALVLK